MKKNIIKTHEELLKLHGKKITCYIVSNFIQDARISIEKKAENRGPYVFVCQNVCSGNYTYNKLGFEFSWEISSNLYPYEMYDRDCENIICLEKYQLEFEF